MNDKKELHLRIQRTDNLNTVVYDDTIGPGNGRHYYEVERDGKTLAEIQFQNGARNEEGSIAGYSKPTFWKSCATDCNASNRVSMRRERTLAHSRISRKPLCGSTSAWQTARSAAYSAR